MVRPWWSMPPDNQNHCRGFLISYCKILYYIEKYPLWRSDSSIVTGFFQIFDCVYHVWLGKHLLNS